MGDDIEMNESLNATSFSLLFQITHLQRHNLFSNTQIN